MILYYVSAFHSVTLFWCYDIYLSCPFNIVLSSHFICQVEDLSKVPQVERELMLVKLNADSSTKGEVHKFFFPFRLFLFGIGHSPIFS